MDRRENLTLLLAVGALILLTGLMFITKRSDSRVVPLALNDVTTVSDENTLNPQKELEESLRRTFESDADSLLDDEIMAALFGDTSPSQDRLDKLTAEGLADMVVSEGHMLGEPDADIVLTAYIDLDDPYGQDFHETLKTLKQEYGNEKVAIVYKHFPVIQLHPNAPALAEASECVAEQNELAFWVFINHIFTQREIDATTDVAQLSTYVKNMGLSVPFYEACMQSGRYEAVVEANFNEATALGVQGTPYTTIVVKGMNEVGVINGAQPIEEVRKKLDGLILQTGSLR